MEREYYLNLAAKGLRMPVGADLILHEHPNAEEILVDGKQLGKVIEETCRRFDTPLAFPRMDLELEKKMLMDMIGIPKEDVAKFHFTSAPDQEIFDKVVKHLDGPLMPAMQAQVDAIKYIAEETDLLPIGMCIGPFSLLTKIIPDPITPVAIAGMGITADEDPEVKLVEESLRLGMMIIKRNIQAQIDAGAKAIFIAEPAANKVYFSPNQIESGADTFERYVMANNREIKSLLESHGVDLIFHCCGELIDFMVEQFASLDPAIMSLGSSRKLWEDAALVSDATVLYGNLPSKKFYSDDLITVQEVIDTGDELVAKMQEVNHPFILGSECDVLSVRGCHDTIMKKADAIAGRVLSLSAS